MHGSRVLLALGVLVALVAVSATETSTGAQVLMKLSNDFHHFVDKDWNESFHAVMHGETIKLTLHHVGGSREVFSADWEQSGTSMHVSRVDVHPDRIEVNFATGGKVPLYFYGVRGLRCGAPSFLGTWLFEGAVLWPHLRAEESKADETATSIARSVRSVRELVDLYAKALEESLMGVSLRSIDALEKGHRTAAAYLGVALETEAVTMGSLLKRDHKYPEDLRALAEALSLQFGDLARWARKMQLTPDDFTEPPAFDWDGTRHERFGMGNSELAEPIAAYERAVKSGTKYTLSEKHAKAVENGVRKGVESAVRPFIGLLDEELAKERKASAMPGMIKFFPSQREQQLLDAKKHLSGSVVDDLSKHVFSALLDSDLSGAMLSTVDDFVVDSMERATSMWDRVRGQNKKAESGVQERKLRPGEDSVAKAMGTTALEGEKTRQVVAQEQAEQELHAKAASQQKKGRMVVPFEVKNKFKPRIKVRGLSVKSINVRNTLSFGNEHFRSELVVDVTLKDPLSSGASAEAVVKSTTTIGNWKFGGDVTTDIEGVYTTQHISTVVVNGFVTYKEGSTNAGLFLSYIAVGELKDVGRIDLKAWYNTKLTNKLSWHNQFTMRSGGGAAEETDQWKASSGFTYDYSSSVQARVGLELDDNQERFRTALQGTITYQASDDLFIGVGAFYGNEQSNMFSGLSKKDYGVTAGLKWTFDCC